MKRTIVIVAALAAALILAGCASLKPFTQDELDRLSYTNAVSIVIG